MNEGSLEHAGVPRDSQGLGQAFLCTVALQRFRPVTLLALGVAPHCRLLETSSVGLARRRARALTPPTDTL